MSSTVLFVSGRETMLRFVSVVCFVPVPLTTWLISLNSRAQWEAEAGMVPWWLLPAGLIAVSLVMPAALLWLHDVYVLRLERTGDKLRVTTFLVWGRRTREFLRTELTTGRARFDEGRIATGLAPTVNAPSVRLRLPNGRRLIFDLQGDAPAGWSELHELLNRENYSRR